MPPKMYRQGDLLIVEIDKIPNKKRLRKVKDKIILRGEATGHAHQLVGGDLYSERWGSGLGLGVGQGRSGPNMYIDIGKTAKIVHQEHDTLELPKGSYQVVRQREYSPWTEEEFQFVND